MMNREPPDRRTGRPQDCGERAAKIRVAIFGVDGVVTDGTLYYGRREIKAFNVRDGPCNAAGSAVYRDHHQQAFSGVELRARNLGIDRSTRACTTRRLSGPARAAESRRLISVLYGDDIIDLPVLRRGLIDGKRCTGDIRRHAYVSAREADAAPCARFANSHCGQGRSPRGSDRTWHDRRD
jgi:hypothetical protein